MGIYPQVGRLTIFLLLFALASLSGCAGAIRSDAVRQLVETEKIGLEKVNQGLKAQMETIRQATDRLKESQQNYLDNLRTWEKELKRAQIFAASPGDLQNKLVREAVFMQFAQLEIDRNDAYGNLQRDFAAQADDLNEAYKKIVAAAVKTEEQLKVLDVYVHESGFTFALESVDVTAIREALSEIDESKKILQKVADAGESAEKALGHARVADRNEHMKELVGTLSLISSRLKELKQAEAPQK